MIRVLFITAKNPFLWQENRYPPLWPSYLAAYAHRELGAGAVTFKYIDGNLKEEIASWKPDMIGISSITQNFNYARDLAATAKSLGLPVVVGGMHITAMPQCLTGDMDVGCLGESEATFVDLLKLFGDRGTFAPDDLEAIPGIVYHGADGPVQSPGKREFLAIDDIPHPDRSLVGFPERTYVYTTRGCPSRCIFCACSRYWGKIRYSSPEYLVEEVAALIDRGATKLRFADENFAANPARLERIADLIVERGFHRRVKFSCWLRANTVNPEVVTQLLRLHVVSVKLGLESGNQRVLSYLKGNVSLDQNIEAIRILKEAGFQVNGDFIFGAPDETPEEIEDTYRFIKEQPLDMVDINIFTPLPATPIWELAKEKGLVSDDMDWRKINIKFRRDPGQQIVLSETLGYRELLKYHKKFEALRFRKTIRALIHSPWRDEIPAVAWRVATGKIRNRFLRRTQRNTGASR